MTTFHYRREPVTEHLLLILIVGALIVVGSTHAFTDTWVWWIETVSPRVALVGGLMVIHTVVFWSLALAFHWVDRSNRPGWIVRHRIQHGERKQPSLSTTLRVLAFNQLVLLPLLLLAFAEIMHLRGWAPDTELPSALRLVLEVVGQSILGLIAFYFAHRLLHRKWWLKRVHRIHHEFHTTTAFASEYAHWFEFAIGNFGALAIGAVVLAPSLASIYVFAVTAVVTILVHHSGYALPWAPWSVPHAWHHHRYHELFGSRGTIDKLLGTAPEYAELRDGDVR